MIDNEVYAVFVSLIVHGRNCTTQQHSQQLFCPSALVKTLGKPA
jgi:hypothetical protein